MLIIPCEQTISCPSTNGQENDWPIQNWTSEDPDRQIFIGYNSGWNWNFPPLGSNWTHSGCLGLCVSTISQADADDCAARMALLCNPDCANPPCNQNTPTSGQLFFNIDAAAQLACPDGSIFTYVVRAGSFVATSQIMADRIALSFAQQRVRQHQICMTALSPTECCVGKPYSATLRATGASLSNQPINLWTITPFALPDGLGFDNGPLVAFSGKSATISGVPTESGTFVFSVRVTSLITGDYMERTFSLCVIGISPDTLPSGTAGTAYTQALSATSCAETNLFWSVTSGSLPAGMTLNGNTGVLSWPSPVAGTYNFTISVLTGEP